MRRPGLLTFCAAAMIGPLLFAVGGAAVEPPPKPGGSAKAAKALDRAVESLRVEARQVRAALRLTAAQPDFAARWSEPVPVEDLSAAMAMRQDRDPFIDAYIRWQLTSFDPPLPPLDDRGFLRFMDAAPPLLENPRAAADILAAFERADAEPALPPQERARLQALAAEMERRAPIAAQMNLPAEAWRDWVAVRLGETGARRLLWLLERCAATIEAGWPTRSIKSRLSREFAEAAGDRSIFQNDRDRIAATARRLIGRSRRMVSEVTMFVAGDVEISFSTAAVDAADVQSWIDRLNGVPRRN
jgi:hypothetical protein